jgi:hypothetical protein
MQYYREPVSLTCPAGSIAEGEPDCFDGYIDNFNGGCNSTPNIFSLLPNGCNQTICGKSGLYNTGSNRDTDWYQFTTTDSTEIYVEGIAEFDLQIGIIDGNAGCPVGSFLTYTSSLEGQTGSFSYVIGPGTWWIWAGPASFSGWVCGSDYILTIKTIEDVPAPVATENPACGLSTTLVPIADNGSTSYYWQGTTCGTSLTNPANVDYTVGATGTYFVNGYNSAVGCWSDACNSSYVYLVGGSVNAVANGQDLADTVCVGDIVNFDALTTGIFDSIEFRWTLSSTVLRDWDTASLYVENSIVEGMYKVEADAQSVGGKTLILHAEDGDDFGWQAMLTADGRCGQVDVFDATYATPTFAYLMEYETIITWTDYPYYEAIVVGDMLADLVDTGKNVVLVAFGNLAGGSGWGLLGRFLADGYCPQVQSDLYTSSATTIGTILQPAHPIMAGVSSITTDYTISSSAYNTGGVGIFDWANGSIGAAEKDFPSTGKTIVLNMWGGAVTGDADLLLANTAAYLHSVGFACSFEDSVYVLVNDVPGAAGSVTGASIVCEGSGAIPYSISSIVDADTYNWIYSGTGASINGTGTNVTMDFPNGSTSGSLTVYGTNECGDGASSFIAITVDPCTGIEENSVAQVNVVPNPNTGLFSIELSTVLSGAFNFKIYNELGQLVMDDVKNLVAGTNRIDIDMLNQPNGAYFLKIMQDDVEVVKAFLIQR